MAKKIDWDKWTVRASQAHKLLVGTIGLTDKEKDERAWLLVRKMANARGENDEKGKPVLPLTQKMENRLVELSAKENDKSLAKTMTNELRKIHRMETYNRNFSISTKYIRKGITQEEEAITNYQVYLAQKGQRVLLTKNTERLYNDWAQGEPDIWRKGDKVGHDTKCSWSLDTFPFANDELDPQYEAQNQVYMQLTGAEQWVTAYCLVNINEYGLNNEKLKEYYALGCPDEEHEHYFEYRKRCMDIERMLIFDYDRFVHAFPYHDLFYTREQWKDEGNDIPLEERIIEKTSYRNDGFIKELKERRLIAIDYLKSLD